METIRDRMTVVELPGGGTAVALRTGAKDLVTIAGSIIGGPAAFGESSAAAADLAAALLDAGAGKLDRTAFREALAARGAELSFSTNGARLSWSAQCFPEDVPYLLDRIADALWQPRLPASELKAEKPRMLAELAEESDDTRSVTERALADLIYEAGHPNRPPTFIEERAQIKAAEISDLKKTARAYGIQHLALSAVGDVDAARFEDAVRRSFGKQPAGITRPIAIAENAETGQRRSVFIEGKANADIALGFRLGLGTRDARYLPLTIVNQALGGSFAAHLMQTVRERDGLTYGVYSRLLGCDDLLDGYFRIWGTFAPELLQKGADTIEREMRTFLADGVTAEKLAAVKEEMTGSFAVSLSTTGALARHLVRTIENDRPLSWLDEYPERIRAVSLEEAQGAAAFLATQPLSVATAGSVMLY